MSDKDIPIPLFKTGNYCESCDMGDKPVWFAGHYVHRWIDLSKPFPHFNRPCTNPLARRMS